MKRKKDCLNFMRIDTELAQPIYKVRQGVISV